MNCNSMSSSTIAWGSVPTLAEMITCKMRTVGGSATAGPVCSLLLARLCGSTGSLARLVSRCFVDIKRDFGVLFGRHRSLRHGVTLGRLLQRLD